MEKEMLKTYFKNNLIYNFLKFLISFISSFTLLLKKSDKSIEFDEYYYCQMKKIYKYLYLLPFIMKFSDEL